MKHFLILVIFSFFFSAKAQDTLCSHQNGSLQKSGNFYIELVNCGNDVEVFIYNKYKKQINADLVSNAEIEFAYLDETFWTVPLLPGPLKNLQARVPDKNFYRLRVSFQIGIAVVTAYFDNELLLLTISPPAKN